MLRQSSPAKPGDLFAMARYARAMIHIATAPWAHYLGDAAVWAGAAATGWWVRTRFPARIAALANQTSASYFVALALGGLAGAWLFGSLNTLRSAAPVLSHSVAGALAGAIVAVEIWKWRMGIRQSTGVPFVLPIAVGIAIGRWGCLFAGPADRTYGFPSTLPWAVDPGDGIARAPVQIYESISMALFALFFFLVLRSGKSWPWRTGFQWLVIFYAAQRFLWEYQKPYPPLLFGLNVFHFLMLGLIAYGLLWIGRGTEAGRRGARG